ncbi:MAG: ABC transporter substrate-binding protein [Candidatus Gracilibacteria bacterium]|jgi:peptide/nickel transport system substrate-binding protein
MRFLKFLISVFKAYDFRDKLVTGFAFAVILLMFVKMIIFPYGFFNFGAPNIYTEGIVSKSGVNNLNPLFVDYNEADREISSLIFSGLMKYDPDKKAIVDDMASLTINEEKTEYTFTVRAGLKWQDGYDFTAEDVYFTFHDVVLNQSFPNEILKTNFSGIEMELIDKDKIKFTLKKPNVFFINNLTVGILPKHLLASVSPSDLLTNDFNKMPIGTGPYMINEPIQRFTDGRFQVILARSPYYYGDVSEIENLRFIVYETMEELIKEINAVNGVSKVTGNYIIDFRNNARFKLLSYQLPQYMAVFMNMESSILKDNDKVRFALKKSVFKKELLDMFVDKIPVETPIMDLKQEDYAIVPSKEEAMTSLKDAGYDYGIDDTEKVGIRYDKDGKALELNLIARLYEEGTYQFDETNKIIGFLQKAWEDIGIDIKVEFLERDDFRNRLSNRGYDLAFVGQNLGYNLDTYSYWHSTQADPRGQNLSNYKSFGVDALIEDIRSTFDLEKRAFILKDLAKQINDDNAAIFLYRPVYYYASDNKLSGISMDGVVYPSDRFARIAQWKFN